MRRQPASVFSSPMPLRQCQPTVPWGDAIKEEQAMADLTIRRLSYALGAEIGGVDLSKPVPDETFRAIRQAWLDQLVLLFRGQKLSPERHIAFSRGFGDLDPNDANPFTRLKDHPEILQITNKKVGGKPS